MGKNIQILYNIELIRKKNKIIEILRNRYYILR